MIELESVASIALAIFSALLALQAAYSAALTLCASADGTSVWVGL